MNSSFYTLDELGLQSDDDRRASTLRANFDGDHATHSVLEINELATLADLQPLWNDLFAKTPNPAFCQTFDWLQLYWTHFGDRQRLRVLCVEDDGNTTGLIVQVEKEAGGRRELTLPSVGPETLWPLGANSYETWFAVGKHLKTEWSRKHVLDLRGLPDPQDVICAALREAGLPVRSQAWASHSIVPLAGDFESIWSNVSRPLRELVDLGEQRLASLGSVNFLRLRPQVTDHASPQCPEKFYQDCLSIALNDESQLARSDSLLNDPGRHRFLRDLMPWAWQRSAADLCLLLVQSRPVAFRLHTRMHGKLRTIWTGADADLRQFPLAEVLLHRTLRDSAQRGDTEIDLGAKPPDSMRIWSDTLVPFRRVFAGVRPRLSAIYEPEETICYDH